MFGPLLVALIIATSNHDYKAAFAALAVPALITAIAARRRPAPVPAAT